MMKTMSIKVLLDFGFACSVKKKLLISLQVSVLGRQETYFYLTITMTKVNLTDKLSWVENFST